MRRTLNLPTVLQLSWLILILLVSLYLRIKGLTTQSYWNDELATIVLTDPDNSLYQVIIETLRDKSPPLYQLILWAWFKLFGFTELTGRSLSAFFGILAVPAMYFMAREYTDRDTAIYASLLTGLNYFHILFSQEVRSYGLFFLLTTLSLMFLSRLIRESNNRNLVLYTFLTICLVQVHYYGVLVYLGQLSVLFMYKKINNTPHDIPARYLKINSCSTLGSMIPVIPYMVKNALKETVWIKTPDLDFQVEYFIRYFGGEVIAVVYAFLFIVGLVFLIRQKAWNRRLLVHLLLFFLLFVYLLPYIRSVLSTPMLVSRYTIGALPVLILIIAAGISVIKHNTLRRLTLAVVIILSIKVLFIDKDYYGGIHKQQYREAIEDVKDNYKDIPVYACKEERIDKYSRMLGHPISTINKNNMFFQLENSSAPEQFLYISSECCGCSDSNEQIRDYARKYNYTLVDTIMKKGVTIFLLSAAD